VAQVEGGPKYWLDADKPCKIERGVEVRKTATEKDEYFLKKKIVLTEPETRGRRGRERSVSNRLKALCQRLLEIIKRTDTFGVTRENCFQRKRGPEGQLSKQHETSRVIKGSCIVEAGG